MKIKKLALPILAAATLSPIAFAAQLPVPGDGSGTVACIRPDATGALRDAYCLDGIPIAFKYDEFYSYSGPLLQAMVDAGTLDASFGDFDFATGVGTLDVVLFTQAGGTDNQGVGVSGTNNFEDPFPSEAGAGSGPDGNTVPTVEPYTFEGWWGQEDQANDGTPDDGAPGNDPDVQGPVTVGQVLTYLQEFDPNNNQPVFYVDWNQTGGGDSLFANAYVQIIDPSDGSVVMEWSLDTLNNGVYDRAAQTYNFGSIEFLGDAAACAANAWDPITGEGCAGVTDSGLDYTMLEHNKGSGKADFIFYAPGMDLSAYDPNYLFVFSAFIGCEENGLPNPDFDPNANGGPNSEMYTTQGCNTNGAEEGFLTGRFSPDFEPPEVPVPGTLFLTGLGLFVLGMRRRAAR